MDFSRRKLPKDAADKMRACPVDTVRPFALMPAPVYAFMKLNEKFVSVKAPLDFFTPEELARLRSFEFFYLPDFVDALARFRYSGRIIQSLLSWKPEVIDPDRAGLAVSSEEVILSPASFELADAVLREIGPLWGPYGTIEPFFAAVFVNELCETLPEELLTSVRDRSLDLFEEAVMVSGWAVFLALHLGYCDLPFLNGLRREVFEKVGNRAPLCSDYRLMDELLGAAQATLRGDYKHSIKGISFTEGKDRLSQKMASRFRRIEKSFLKTTAPLISIFGEKGFVDV